MSFQWDEFDATQEVANDFEALPAGDYKVHIYSSTMKPTKAGTGEYLEVTLEVLEGKYKGRKLWDRLNLRNPNEKAESIAKATLAKICQSVGVLKPKRPEDLQGRPLVASVTIRQYNGSEQNAISGYRATKSKPAAESATSGSDDDCPF